MQLNDRSGRWVTMTEHPEIPVPRLIGMVAVQSLLFAAGLFALIVFLEGRCGETVPSSWWPLAILWLGFLPIITLPTIRRPGPRSAMMRRASFGLFFLALLSLSLAGPGVPCDRGPDAMMSALWVALAAWVLTVALWIVPPRQGRTK